MLRNAAKPLQLVARLCAQNGSAMNCAQFRGMALEGAKGFSEKENAIENMYFTKEDQRLMSKLLTKIKDQSDISDKHAAEGVAFAERSALKHVIAKYNINEADMERLIKWKHTHY